MRVVSETGSRSNILDKLKRYYLLFDIYDVGTTDVYIYSSGYRTGHGC